MDDHFEDRSASMRKAFRVLFKRKRLMAILFLSTVSSVAIGTFTMAPIYRAKSTIIVDWEKDAEKTLILELNWWIRRTEYDRIAAEMKILKSRPIAERVVETLGIAEKAQDSASDGNAWAAVEYEQAVAKTMKSVKVTQAKDTNVLEVACTDRDPKRAAAIVNSVVQQYSKHRAELAKDLRAYDFFDEQIRMTTTKLEDLERHEANFKNKEGVIVPEEEAAILYTKLGDYEETLTEVRTKRIGKEAKLRVIKESLGEKGEVAIPSTETSDSPSREEYLSRLKTELLALELERNKLAQRYTRQHPRIVALKTEIGLVQDKLRDELQAIISEEETNIKALLAEEAVLEAKIAELNGGLRQFAKNEFELSRISRGIKENQEVYSLLLKQREEARIAMSKQDQIVGVKVVSAAVPPSVPVRPNKPLYLSLAVVFGLILALGSAFFVESLDHSIETADDVRQTLGFPVLTSIGEVDLFASG